MNKLKHYIKVYLGLSKAFKRLFWRAAWWSLWAELDLKLNNFRYFRRFQDNQTETPITTLSLAQRKQVIWMQNAMRILEHRAPWKPMCLNRAVVAKRLLQKQGIETTLHIGFKARGSETEEFEGHAWLTIKRYFITGLIPQLPQYKKLKPIKDLSQIE